MLDNLSKWVLNVLRGGPNFDPVKYVKEVSHVKYMHADSILIHPNFSSKLIITWRKPTFDPVQTNEGGSKVSFRTIHDHVIDKLFENLILIHFH